MKRTVPQRGHGGIQRRSFDCPIWITPKLPFSIASLASRPSADTYTPSMNSWTGIARSRAWLSTRPLYSGIVFISNPGS